MQISHALRISVRRAGCPSPILVLEIGHLLALLLERIHSSLRALDIGHNLRCLLSLSDLRSQGLNLSASVDRSTLGAHNCNANSHCSQAQTRCNLQIDAALLTIAVVVMSLLLGTLSLLTFELIGQFLATLPMRFRRWCLRPFTELAHSICHGHHSLSLSLFSTDVISLVYQHNQSYHNTPYQMQSSSTGCHEWCYMITDQGSDACSYHPDPFAS